MKKTSAICADELAASPMTQIGLKLPVALLERVDAAAVRDDESCRNRSSIMRRALVQFLRREHEAAR
ncbi:hypothetical protein J4G48_0015815 [Bradyrhizobium barranii subsp. apii]|uniref:hypothetical protein n=1 Tax=Bradyrhizobium barranii TaxID=2992140 RepID=UPI001AA14046|nr:hypothetical protein [Bradyrhizobium barranii]UPT99422.1 hypothetical protein J4G48_0015815 [Bradyrhizobium barranii subsp. apii]